MAEVKILVKRPFEIRLDAKGEPSRFPCTILNGEVIPKEYVVQETLLDHWYMKELINRGRVEVISAKSDVLSPAENMTIEDMTKAQLVEAIRQTQPEFDPGRMTRAQLVEVLKEVTAPAENGSGDGGNEGPGPEGPGDQENPE